MRRKIISILLAFIGFSVVGYSFLYILDFFNQQKSGILITSEPVSDIYINGQFVGVTPYESEINPGEIIIKIRPQQASETIFDDYETKIDLVPGVKTIIKRIFKSDDDGSSGATVSFEKISGDDSLITVISVPDRAKIFIDDKLQGYTPLRLSIPAGDHDLSVQSDGYIDVSLPVKVYKGFKLTASVKLAKVEDLTLVEPEPTVSTEVKKQIKIKRTTIGFLRVREGAGIGFPEVTKVKPDEVYDILNTGESGSWYKIKVGEIEGWVSAEFVAKL